jgi:class 3 adenylate cyclase
LRCGDPHLSFTDIEGSTVLLRRLGHSVYAQVLADHHSVIRSGLAAHGGKEVDTHAWPAGERVRVRMGVHTGEAATTVTGLVGVDVHRAARVAALAYGGQVLLSETAAVLVRDSLPQGAALKDLGVHRLKDLGSPEHCARGISPLPGFTSNRRHKRCRRPGLRIPGSCRSTSAGCCARRATRTVRGPSSKRACERAAIAGTVRVWDGPHRLATVR